MGTRLHASTTVAAARKKHHTAKPTVLADLLLPLLATVARDEAHALPIKLAQWRQRGLWQQGLELIALGSVQQF